jgi:hypothetical protein
LLRVTVTGQPVGAGSVLWRGVGDAADALMPQSDQVLHCPTRGPAIVDVYETGGIARQLAQQDNREPLLHQGSQLLVVGTRAGKDDTINVFGPDQVEIGVGLADVLNRFEEQAKASLSGGSDQAMDHLGQKGIGGDMRLIADQYQT